MKRLWNRDRRTCGSHQRGDTLVEVAIAMAVLGLVLAATMTIINRSLLSVMNAVERTGARGEVNSQSRDATLRFRYAERHKQGCG